MLSTLQQTRDGMDFVSGLIGREDDVGAWARRELALRLPTVDAVTGVNKARELLGQNLALHFAGKGSNDYASTNSATFADRRALAMVNAAAEGSIRPQSALGLFSQLISDGWSPSVSDQFVIGQLHVLTGDWTQGRRYMLPLLSDKDLRQPVHVRTYANLLLNSGEAPEAQLWLDRLREANDDSVETVRLLAQVKARRGQYESVLAA